VVLLNLGLVLVVLVVGTAKMPYNERSCGDLSARRRLLSRLFAGLTGSACRRCAVGALCGR
jgi:hypothetical protein